MAKEQPKQPTLMEAAITQPEQAQQSAQPTQQPAQAQDLRNTEELPTQSSAPVPAKIKKKEVDKSLVTSSIKRLPPVLAPLAACFDDAWGSFVKAYGHGGGQVMACEIDFAVQAMCSNTYLIECAQLFPFDFANAIKNVALSGLSLSPVLKLGYLVPFKKRVMFMPSYMGLVELLVSNGIVAKVEAHPVFEGEFFKIEYGSKGGLKHIPNPWGKREKENLLGVYYYVRLSDGAEMFDTLSLEEVEKLRKRAPSNKSEKETPWDTDYIEMAKKCGVRRAFKMIPKRGISDDKLKVVEVAFEYDEKVEREWLEQRERKAITSQANRFDEDIETVEAEEIKE